MRRSHTVTRLDVIQAVRAVAVHDEATIAAGVHLIRSGQGQRCAEALTAMIDVWATADAAA